MPSPDARSCGRTARETAAASGVFTSPKPAPSRPPRAPIERTSSPAAVESPSTATRIAVPPSATRARAPTLSTRRPDSTPKAPVSTAIGTSTTPTSSAVSPFAVASRMGSPMSTPRLADMTRKLMVTSAR